MSHAHQVEFFQWVRSMYPSYFRATRVLDCGSLNINGSCQQFFQDCAYLGIDVGPGPNVDLVCAAHAFRTEKLFDAVVSAEMIEHSRTWKEDLENMVQLLRAGGLLVVTGGGDGRAEHGTLASDPSSSPHTTDYYGNVSNAMFSSAVRPADFQTYFLRQKNADLQFFGIKAEFREE